MPENRRSATFTCGANFDEAQIRLSRVEMGFTDPGLTGFVRKTNSESLLQSGRIVVEAGQ